MSGGGMMAAPGSQAPAQTGPTTGGPGLGLMNHMVQPTVSPGFNLTHDIKPVTADVKPNAGPSNFTPMPTPIGQEPPLGTVSSTGMGGLNSAIRSTTTAFQPPAPQQQAPQPYTYQPYQSYSQPQQPYSNYYQPQQGGINQPFSQQYNSNQQQQQLMSNIQALLSQLFGQNRR